MRRSLQNRVVPVDNARYHGAPRSRSTIDLIVMHCTAGASAHSSITWLNRENVPSGQRASYHYVVDRDGAIYRMCKPEMVAFHAGTSSVPGAKANVSSVNPRSIGIAWANLNNGEQLTSQQIESALWLCSVFMGPNIPIERVLGHCEVSPGRKTDPHPAIDMITWRSMLRDYLRMENAA